VGVGPAFTSKCQLLREDPELAESIEPARRAQAMSECTSRAIAVPPGPWSGGGVEHEDCIGLLILDGFMIRRVGIEGRFGAELLGQGDLLRPWKDEHESATLLLTASWSVVEPARLAVLDSDFLQYVARYPQMAASLVGRAVHRSLNLAVNMAIVHQARVDVRLHMLLWHLAGRWGRVRSDGMMLPLRLTHVVLADLVAARRPTVTSALSDLARRGQVRPEGDGWLLLGEPPGQLRDLGEMRRPGGELPLDG
jgi:hypothetical protein